MVENEKLKVDSDVLKEMQEDLLSNESEEDTIDEDDNFEYTDGAEVEENQIDLNVNDAKMDEVSMIRDMEEKNKQHKVYNMLTDIKIDISSIKYVDEVGDISEKLKRISSKIFKQQISKQVVLPLSGYVVFFNGLSLNDLNTLKTLKADDYTAKDFFFKLIYSKIVSTNLSPEGNVPDYETWLHITAFNDYRNLIYGLYAASYSDKTKYNIFCNHNRKVWNNEANTDEPVEGVDYTLSPCKYKNQVELYPEEFVQIIKDKDIIAELERLSYEPDFGRDLINKSLSRINEKFITDNKIIFTTKLPSIYDYLHMNKITDPKTAELFEDIISLLGYIKEVAIPDVDKYMSTGKLEFIPVTKKEDIFDLFANKLDRNIYRYVIEKLEKYIEKYYIEYKFPDVVCGFCKNKIKGELIDFEKFLFRF